jgi:crossover junction endodeoxyribonuclease RuvC
LTLTKMSERSAFTVKGRMPWLNGPTFWMILCVAVSATGSVGDFRPARYMRVPSELTTGYGVVEFSGSKAHMLRAGALRFPRREEFGARLRGIHRLITELVEEFAPDALAVESVFSALNVGTALRLAEVRGVILLAAAQAGIPAHSYAPREVKASVTGYGAASKPQIQQMVKVLLCLSQPPEPSDAADALAVALCHAHIHLARARVARGSSPVRIPSLLESLTAAAARGRTRMPSARIQPCR